MASQHDVPTVRPISRGSRVGMWASSLIIRAVFARDAGKTAGEMQRHLTPAARDVEHHTVRIPHHPGAFDVFRSAPVGRADAAPAPAPAPASEPAPAPAVVWIHGGAWISGRRSNVEPYLRLLAAQGFVVVGVDYPVSPRRTYPAAIQHLAAVLTTVTERADELGIDPRRIVLAGDSAGAQLASQLAVLATNADYRASTGLSAGLDAGQLRAVVLNCGVYDLQSLAKLSGVLGWGFKTALWAYTGRRDWAHTAAGTDMSTINWVGGEFPPAYISGGNGDGLTRSQSKPLARRLRELSVPVTEKFWPDEHEPPLPHEYQFHLDRPEAKEALDATVAFLRSVV